VQFARRERETRTLFPVVTMDPPPPPQQQKSSPLLLHPADFLASLCGAPKEPRLEGTVGGEHRWLDGAFAGSRATFAAFVEAPSCSSLKGEQCPTEEEDATVFAVTAKAGGDKV